MILIKSMFNKNQNNYYHNIFLEKFSYQLGKMKKEVFESIIMWKFGEMKVAKK